MGRGTEGERDEEEVVVGIRTLNELQVNERWGRDRGAGERERREIEMDKGGGRTRS